MNTLINRTVWIGLASVLVAACTPEAKEDPAVESMREAAKVQEQMLDAVATLVEAWDTGATDTLDAIVSADVVRIAPDQNVSSLEELKTLIAGTRTIYPDFRISNDGMVAGPDTAFVEWTVNGTDSGSENATGNSFETTGISRYTFADGMIVREHVVFDTGDALTQLEREELPHANQ